MNCTKILNSRKRVFLSSLSISLVCSQSILAGGSDVWFTPLTESAPVTDPNSIEETFQPWSAPEGIFQTNLLSLREVEDVVLSPLQSIVRVPGLDTSGSMFDMIAYDDTGEYLFIPHETMVGAGVSRHDIADGSTQVLFSGDLMGIEGDWSNDFGAFDPCRFTPNETLFLGEEWSGEGRIIEVMNPFGAAGEITIRELNSIANVAHEGIQFSKQYSKVIYYVDEWNSGSFYKFVMSEKGDYTKGQTFVLKVNAYEGNAADYYNEPSNADAVRTGMATWIPLTDEAGVTLEGIPDPFRNGPSTDPRTDENVLGGRPAADAVGATPYGRPEDMEVGRLANGNEVLYIAATSELAVYSIEILSDSTAKVGVLVSNDTAKNLGYAETTASLNSPDNLAQDEIGNIYIVEDAPNGSDTGGDIWFVRDVNNDGVAESLDHFLSIRVDGCEATGMIFNPEKPTEFVVAVQHPDSTNLNEVPNGLGDAVWKFDISSSEFDYAVARAKWLKAWSRRLWFWGNW